MRDSTIGGSNDEVMHTLEVQGDTVSLSPSSTGNSETIPAGFTREYRVLAEVCGSMSSGFLLLNQREQITYANQSILRLLRISKNDLVVGQDFDVRTHLLSIAADPQLARSELERLWHTHEQEHSADLALTNAVVRWLRVHTFPVRDQQGVLLGRGLLFDDVTLEKSTVQARSETLALAAHEIKTPLAVIKGCATTLLGSSSRWEPAMQREMLQMIDTQSDRLYDILNTLLDVWRFEAGTHSLRLTQVHLPELLEQLVKRWQRNVAERHFLLESSSAVLPVPCDVTRIEQVMNHLLNNAVTYSHASTTIKILLETNDVEVRISVSDEGIGIASEHLEHIFERFYRVELDEAAHKSTGLGLASSRATIEAHGGKIWADSPGREQGASFYFTLPFMARTPAVTQSQVASALAETTSTVQRNTSRVALFKHEPRTRVLLAESDARVTRYLRANLEEQGYRVHTVSHGIQCLRQLELEEPDVIMLSTHLADMSGIELLQRLREFSHAPVIMLCDDCEEDERVHLFDLGSDDLVVKPFGMKELLARIRALLRRQSAGTEQTPQQSIFTSGDLTIDYVQHLVTVQERQVQLSRTEYKLLSLLAQNAGMVVTHELLLEKVWGPEYNRDVDFIWVYISRLRRKVEANSRHPKYIVTIPDVGYKLTKL